MKSNRRAEAIWIESRQRWQINVQKNCIRRTFISSKAGRAGKHEAEAKADKWLERFTTEQTVSSALDLFLEDKESRVKPQTYRQYKGEYDKHIRAYFAPTKRLSAITEYDWQKLIDNCSMAKESSQKHLIGLIHDFIVYCQSRRWEIDEPRALHTTDDAKKSKEKKALPKEQLSRLLALTYDDHELIEFFQLLVLTGCRKSELMNIKWNDISENSLRIKSGKTANAARIVPLMPQAQEVIRGIREGSSVVTGYVFHNEFGSRYETHQIDYAWHYKIAPMIGAVGYTIHELRHTYISICKASVPTVLLKQAVGHSVSMDTIGIYGHTTDQDITDTAIASSEAFDKVLK